VHQKYRIVSSYILVIKEIIKYEIISIANRARIGEKSIIAIGGSILLHIDKKGSVTSETNLVSVFGRVGIHERIIRKKIKKLYSCEKILIKKINCFCIRIII